MLSLFAEMYYFIYVSMRIVDFIGSFNYYNPAATIFHIWVWICGLEFLIYGIEYLNYLEKK